MNLKKNLGRIATAFVATAMLASLTAVPASAANGTTGTPGTELTEITIEKELVMPTNVNMPSDASFTFAINPVTDVTNETLVDGGTAKQEYDVNPGIGTGVTTAGSVESADFGTPSEETIGDEQYNIATATVTLTLPTDTFENPGIYKYQIDEGTLPSDDYVDKTGSMDLYLMVENVSDECVITGAYVKKDGLKIDTWTNYYMLDENLQSKAGDLKVTKTVTGSMGDHSDTFTFTIENLPEGKTFTGNYSDNTPAVTLSKTSNTFTLTHEQTITVKGLDEGTYTIKEAAASSTDKGYEVSFDKDDNATEDGAQLKVEGGKVDDNAVATTCTNTRNAVSPTGIVMDIAPYALLVVVAAAGCFVFLRKRRED